MRVLLWASKPTNQKSGALTAFSAAVLGVGWGSSVTCRPGAGRDLQQRDGSLYLLD